MRARFEVCVLGIRSLPTPATRARQHDHPGKLLTWVRDETARMLVHNSYDSDWLVSQDFGNGHTLRYRYDLSKNRKYAETVLITMPDGAVKLSAPRGR